MSIFKLDLNYKNLLVIAGAVFVAILLYKIEAIISIFAISFFVAYLLDPIIDKMESLKIPRGLGILLLIVLIAVVVVIAVLALLPQLYSEIKYLADTMPELISSLADTAQKLAEKFGFDTSISGLKEQLAPKAGEIVTNAMNAGKSVLTSTSSAIGSIVNLAIIPILVFYFLKDFDRINEKFFANLEKRYSGDYRRYLKEFDQILSVYFRGQIIVAAILAVLYTAVLLISGVKPAILIGLVSGILSIVPYLGFIIGFGTSLVLSIIQFQDFLHPLMVICGFAIVQVVEGNIITPKIVGESLGLHPTAVIFALLAGGSLFGIGGMIIALPVAAFIKILLKEQFA